jgi:IclR family KDG regulon transcriptional repressor
MRFTMSNSAGGPGRGRPPSVPRKNGDARLATSLLKAVDILEALGGEAAVPLGEVANRVGLGKTGVYRVLNTLVTRGYVERVGRDGKYRLGLRAFTLGANALANRQIRDAAALPMRDLLRKTNEMVNLGVPSGNGIIIIDRLQLDRAVQLRSNVGVWMSLESTSIGRAYLATLPEDEIEPPDPHLATVLADARRTGYAIDDGDSDPEIRCASAAIRDEAGRVVGTIGVSAPAYRLSLERIASEVGPAVIAAADAVTCSLGGSRFCIATQPRD